MAVKETELEIVQYRVDEVSHATRKLFYNFAEYTDFEAAEFWMMLGSDLIELIKNQQAFNCLWEATAMDVNLSYFSEPIPIFREDKIFYSAQEPTISFIERPANTLPTTWTHVNKVTRDIAEEMRDVYHMRVENNPLRLIFPKEEYAKTIDHFTVPIIDVKPLEFDLKAFIF